MLKTHRGAHTANVVKYNVNSPRGSNKVGALANWRKKKNPNSAEDVVLSSPFTLKKKSQINKILVSLKIQSVLAKEFIKMATG